jgi:hypothetical protein
MGTLPVLVTHSVDSPPTLDGVQAKLSRARYHFKTLGEACSAAIKDSTGEPYVEREGDWEVVRIRIGEFPLWPSLVSGDYAHNLRSALDHLVWQLVKVSGAKPGTWNSFPSYGNKDDFLRKVKQRAKKGGRGPLGGIEIGGPIWTLIESCQPYKNTKLPTWLPTDVPNRNRWQPRLTHLGMLSALNNIDKHRTIHGVSVFPGKGRPINQSLDWNSDAVLIEQKDRETWDPLEDRAELARFRFRPGVEPNVRVTGPIFLQPGFEAEFTETDAVTVLLPSLQALGEGVEQIIDSFAEFFPA